MASDNYITHFTAADIEKYHRGQLSAKQMHDLEKAALDDPFLADALEGYATDGVNAAADLAELKNKLEARVEGAKVIPLQTVSSGGNRSFRPLRAAVMILFIAGAGLLVYKLGSNKKNDNGIAQAENPKKETVLIDTSKKLIEPVGNITDTTIYNIKTGYTTATSENKQEFTVTQGTGTTPNPPVVVNGSANVPPTGSTITTITVPGEVVTSKGTTTQPNTNSPVKTADDVARLKKEADKTSTERKDGVVADFYAADKAKNDAEDAARAKENVASQQNRNVANSRRAENNNYYNNTNTFRGRVVDADNNGVPFANVTNVQDRNAGTFTDAKGYFNLTYPDSVLNVQVRSIGFESNNVQLRNSVPNNQVVMNDDRKALSEVTTVGRQRVDANAPSRDKDNNMKLETPEPVDGWVSYNTYVENNLDVPEDLRNKPTSSGEVQVSFEVDQNGEPTKFKIEKSLCTKCDKEAIRLIKDGPKWKRNANKKGRTTVTISF